MKKIFTLFVLLTAGVAFSQGKIAERVAELKSSNVIFQHFSVLDGTSDTPSSKVATVVDKASFAKIRTADVNAIVQTAPEAIEIEIPYQGTQIKLELFKAKLLNEEFHVDTDKEKSITYNPGVYYRGIVKNDGHSVVSMNFFNGEMNGIVSADNIGNLNVGKLLNAGNTTDYIIYSDADMKIMNPFNCSMKFDAEDPNYTGQAENTNRSALSTRCVTVYFELDYALYQQNGSSTTNTNNWITSVFNNTATLYANDGITTALKSTFVWTTQDPYSGDGSSDYLYQFNEVRPVFDGDLGMLCGIDPGGLGGVAVTINGLCSANNFCYSDVELGFSTVPTYSWTVEVVTHELGHLFGSPHTHACVWNGNATAIDNCAPYAIGSTAEGYNCMTTPATLPSTTVKGTIMSYCHLVSGIGINFNNGFGTQPTNRILTAVNAGTCLSTDCVNTCINLVSNIQATNVTTNSATITWNESGTSAQWQVLVNAFAVNFGSYQNVTATTFNTNTNLTPNAFYKARVKPLCTSAQAAPRQGLFATAANWCNGVTITDTGGTSGEYTDMEEYTRVMIPTVANKKIQLSLTQFNLESGYDYLYIYDGPSTSATDLTNGGLTGAITSNFPVYTSSSPDGALTLRFFSDQGVTAAGYTASVSCQNMLGIHESEDIDFTYYPNPAKDAVNIVAKSEITNIEVYNVAGQLLYTTKANALEAKVDISSYSTGTYFFKVKFGEYSGNFKIMKF